MACRSNQPAICYCIVLSEHSHGLFLTYSHWLLLYFNSAKWQSWVVTTETMEPTEPKIFTIWPFAEKFTDPLVQPFLCHRKSTAFLLDGLWMVADLNDRSNLQTQKAQGSLLVSEFVLPRSMFL